jgi:hypothetical protein
MVELNTTDVQLIDLEDMYMPGESTPFQLNRGSPGYRHRSGDEGVTTWRPDGDRYATAVLAAEMLVLANANIACKATDEGFFAENSQTPLGRSRFKEAQVYLKRIAPEFAAVFNSSWFAGSLEDCPRISELHRPIKKLACCIPSDGSKGGTPSISSPGLGTVTWKPLAVSRSGQTPPRPPAQVSNRAKPVVTWHQNDRTSTEPQADESERLSSVVKAVLAVVVILFLLMLLQMCSQL